MMQALKQATAGQKLPPDHHTRPRRQRRRQRPTTHAVCTSSNTNTSPQQPVRSRRSLLAGAGAVSILLPSSHPGAAQASRLQQDARLVPLRAFWQLLVAYLQPQLSNTFAPNLVFYGPGELLPSGTPGNPAQEYQRQKAAKCGPLRSGGGFEQPYACCPGVPGDLADGGDTARDCCRHFAFAVPRSRYAFAALDRQTSVVASPRLALAAAATWQGVLVHEMGHAIDFFAFPQRYQLPGEPAPSAAAAAAALAAIDAQQPDAELRADLMANALLMPLLGQQLCYNSRTRIQSLVPLSTLCALEEEADEGSTSSSDPPAAFMQHFPHPPVSA